MTANPAASQRFYARVAGAALLLICLSGLLSNDLIVPGDAAASARNVVAHQLQFHLGVFGELVMLNADIVLAVAFYILLKPIDAALALLGGFWRFANAMMLAVGVTVSLVAFDDVSDGRYLGPFDEAQMAALMRQMMDIHGAATVIGLVFFGLGAAVHAYLLWRSRYIPRVLALPYLIVTGVIFVSFLALVVFPDLEKIVDPWVIAPDFVIELLVALWLLIRGAKIGRPGLAPETANTMTSGPNK